MEKYLLMYMTIYMKPLVWKLRIPFILFVFGSTTGIFQFFTGLFHFDNSLWISIVYIGINALIIWFLEVNGINEKRVHFSIGLLLIAAAIFIDLLFVG